MSDQVLSGPLRPPTRLPNKQDVVGYPAYNPKPSQRLDTPPHADSPGNYASTSSDHELTHYLNGSSSSHPRTKPNVARLAQQRMILTGGEEGPTVRQHLQQQQAASKMLASVTTANEANSQSPGPNGPPFTDPPLPAPPRRQRPRSNGRAKNQAISQQLTMQVQPIVRVGVPPPNAIPTTSASPPTVGTPPSYTNHGGYYPNHYQTVSSPNRQQMKRPSAPTPAHPQNVQIVVGPRPSTLNDPEMGQRSYQVGRPNSQGFLPQQGQQYRVKIQQLEKGEELDTQRIYGARQQTHPSQIQRPSAPVPPSPSNEENRFRYNSGESSQSSYEDYNDSPQMANLFHGNLPGPNPQRSQPPQNVVHTEVALPNSLNHASYQRPAPAMNRSPSQNHMQPTYHKMPQSQPGPSFPTQTEPLNQNDGASIGHMTVQQAIRKRVKDRRMKKENEPSDDTDTDNPNNLSLELPEETFENFNLSGGDLDDVDDNFLQIFADEEREFHTAPSNPIDLDKELGLLSEEGIDISGDLFQQLCSSDQLTMSKELFEEFVENLQAEEEEKTKNRPGSRQMVRSQQELQHHQQIQRHHLLQQQLRQQQQHSAMDPQSFHASQLQRQPSQQQLKQLFQQRHEEAMNGQHSISLGQAARLQALRQAHLRQSNTPLDAYSQQQLEAHKTRERDDMYKRKSRFMRRSINALVYKNAALCDEVGRLNQRIQTVVEERKVLAKRLNHFEKNHLRRLNTAKKKKEEAARQRESMASLEAEKNKEQIKAAAAAAAAVANARVAEDALLSERNSMDEMVASPKKRSRSSLPSPRSSGMRKRISEEQISQEVNVLLQGIKADQQSRVSARMAQGSPIKLPATLMRRDSFRREPPMMPIRLSVTPTSDIPITTPLSISPASDSSVVLPPLSNGENSPGQSRNTIPLLIQKSPMKSASSFLSRSSDIKEEPDSPYDSPLKGQEKRRDRKGRSRRNGEGDSGNIKMEIDSSETPSPVCAPETKLNLENLSEQMNKEGERFLRKRRFTTTPEIPDIPAAKRRRTRGSSLATNDDEVETAMGMSEVKREEMDGGEGQVGPIDESIVADILREVRRRRREMSRDTSESRSIRSTPAPDTPDTPSTEERSRRNSRGRPRHLIDSSPTPIPPTPPPESLKEEPRSLRLRERKDHPLTPQSNKPTRTNLERAVKRKS